MLVVLVVQTDLKLISEVKVYLQHINIFKVLHIISEARI